MQLSRGALGQRQIPCKQHKKTYLVIFIDIVTLFG